MLAGVCVVVTALWAAQEVLVPLALAILLTFLLAPLVRRLERWGLGRVVSVLSVVLAAFALLAGIGWMVSGQLIELADNLPVYKENIKNKMQALPGSGGGIIDRARGTIFEITEELKTPTTSPATMPAAVEGDGRVDLRRLAMLTPDGLADALSQALREGEPLPVRIVEDPLSPMEVLGETLMTLAEPLAMTGIVIVLVIFMLLQREDLRDRIIRLLGRGQLRLTTSALDDAARRISRYLVAQAIVNGSYGVAVAIGLWVIGWIFAPETGFPNWALWGLLAAVIRFIPYLGPWIGAALPVLLSALVFEGVAPLLTTVGYFVVLELWSNNLMEPWLYGSSTGMSATAVIVAAVFWTWLWGPIGLVLATPLTTCLVVLGKHVPQMGFLDVLLGDAPVLDPPARIYQRLLAMDQEEASDLLAEFAEDRSLREIYEGVLLPALAMAEADRHAGQLDERRQEFIHSAMRDLVEEVSDQARTEQVQQQAQQTVEIARGDRTLPGKELRRPMRILALPASDEADEIAALMLKSLLEQQRCEVTVMSATSLASEMLHRVEADKPEIVIISALPPSATTRARYLCKRLGNRGDLPMIVGLWTVKSNIKRARDRLSCIASVQVVTSFGECLEVVNQLSERMRVGK